MDENLPLLSPRSSSASPSRTPPRPDVSRTDGSQAVVYASEVKVRSRYLWRTRWMVLSRDGMLAWYKSQMHYSPKGDAPIASIDVLELCSVTGSLKDLTLMLLSGIGVSHKFKVRSTDIVNIWLSVISDKLSLLRRQTDFSIQEAMPVQRNSSLWEVYDTNSVKQLAKTQQSTLYTAAPSEAPREIDSIRVVPWDRPELVSDAEVRAWQMASMGNPHMLQLHSLFVWGGQLAMVTELLPKSSLKHLSHQIPLADVRAMVLRIACSCSLLHQFGSAHGALSLSALLINEGAIATEFKLAPTHGLERDWAQATQEAQQDDVYQLALIARQLLGTRADEVGAELLEQMTTAATCRCSMRYVALHHWFEKAPEGGCDAGDDPFAPTSPDHSRTTWHDVDDTIFHCSPTACDEPMSPLSMTAPQLSTHAAAAIHSTDPRTPNATDVIEIGQTSTTRARSQTWNLKKDHVSFEGLEGLSEAAALDSELGAVAENEQVRRPSALETMSSDSVREDSLDRVLHTCQKSLVMPRGRHELEVTVPIALAGCTLHLELHVEGTVLHHPSVTVSLLMIHTNEEPNWTSRVMGKRAVSGLFQQQVQDLMGPGKLLIVLENSRSSWTRKKVHLKTLVRAPDASKLTSPTVSGASLGVGEDKSACAAVLKLKAGLVEGPLSRVPATCVAVSIDGSRPQVLQLNQDESEDWIASSTCVLDIPDPASVVLAVLCNSGAALSERYGRAAHGHGMLLVSQLMERQSWYRIVAAPTKIRCDCKVLLVPGPPEVDVFDQVQGMCDTTNAAIPSYVTLKVNLQLLPRVHGWRARLWTFVQWIGQSIDSPTTELPAKAPNWPSVLGPPRIKGDFTEGATEQHFQSAIARDHKARILQCAAVMGESMAWLHSLSNWDIPWLSATVLSVHCLVCLYASLWQVPLIFTAAVMTLGYLCDTSLKRSRPGESDTPGLRAKYNKYKTLFADMQNQVGRLVSVFERLLNLWHWENRDLSIVFCVVGMLVACVASALVVVVQLIGIRQLGLIAGLIGFVPSWLRPSGPRRPSENATPSRLLFLWRLFLRAPDALEVTLQSACRRCVD